MRGAHRGDRFGVGARRALRTIVACLVVSLAGGAFGPARTSADVVVVCTDRASAAPHSGEAPVRARSSDARRAIATSALESRRDRSFALTARAARPPGSLLAPYVRDLYLRYRVLRC